MSTRNIRLCFGLVLSFLLGGSIGCNLDPATEQEHKPAQPAAAPRTETAPPAGEFPATEPTVEPQDRPEPKIDPGRPVLAQEGKIVPMGKNVFLQVLPGDRRRVLVNAYVCRRTDLLEQLLCRKYTKEHEAILAFDGDARLIHAALIAARAKPGHPVQFQPKYQPAQGDTIQVLLQYRNPKGKTATVPAQSWLRDVKTKKAMEAPWVFAGSKLYEPPEPGQPPSYAANVGDVICVSNFDTALLDLPIRSSAEDDQLTFEAWTDRIPPLGTPVQVILQPVLPKK